MEEGAEESDATKVDEEMKDEVVEVAFRTAWGDEAEYEDCEVESPPVIDEDDTNAVASVVLFGCPVSLDGGNKELEELACV